MSKKAELIGNYYPTIYLTVISLLQGIALSQLVPIFISYFQLSESPLQDVRLLPLVIMLVVVFIVWHHYSISIFFLRWFPNIIDTIIPFFISISQFFLIAFLIIKTSVADIQIEAWSKGFAYFLLAGTVPYINATIRIGAEYFTNIMSMENAIAHSQHVRKYYKLSAFAILIQGILALIIAYTGLYNLLILSLILLLGHVVISEYFLMLRIKKPFVKAIDEYDAAVRRGEI